MATTASVNKSGDSDGDTSRGHAFTNVRAEQSRRPSRKRNSTSSSSSGRQPRYSNATYGNKGGNKGDDDVDADLLVRSVKRLRIERTQTTTTTEECVVRVPIPTSAPSSPTTGSDNGSEDEEKKHKAEPESKTEPDAEPDADTEPDAETDAGADIEVGPVPGTEIGTDAWVGSVIDELDRLQKTVNVTLGRIHLLNRMMKEHMARKQASSSGTASTTSSMDTYYA